MFLSRWKIMAFRGKQKLTTSRLRRRNAGLHEHSKQKKFPIQVSFAVRAKITRCEEWDASCRAVMNSNWNQSCMHWLTFTCACDRTVLENMTVFGKRNESGKLQFSQQNNTIARPVGWIWRTATNIKAPMWPIHACFCLANLIYLSHDSYCLSRHAATNKFSVSEGFSHISNSSNKNLNSTKSVLHKRSESLSLGGKLSIISSGFICIEKGIKNRSEKWSKHW